MNIAPAEFGLSGGVVSMRGGYECRSCWATFGSPSSSNNPPCRHASLDRAVVLKWSIRREAAAFGRCTREQRAVAAERVSIPPDAVIHFEHEPGEYEEEIELQLKWKRDQ